MSQQFQHSVSSCQHNRGSEASYLSLIAGPGGFGSGATSVGGGGGRGGVGELFSRGAVLSPGRSSTSLESEDQAVSVAASETTLEEDSEDTQDTRSKGHSRCGMGSLFSVV